MTKTLAEHLEFARSKKKADWNKDIDYKAMSKLAAEARKKNREERLKANPKT